MKRTQTLRSKSKKPAGRPRIATTQSNLLVRLRHLKLTPLRIGAAIAILVAVIGLTSAFAMAHKDAGDQNEASADLTKFSTVSENDEDQSQDSAEDKSKDGKTAPTQSGTYKPAATKPSATKATVFNSCTKDKSLCAASLFAITSPAPCHNNTSASCNLNFTADQLIQFVTPIKSWLNSEFSNLSISMTCSPAANCEVPTDSSISRDNSQVGRFFSGQRVTRCCDLLQVKAGTTLTVNAPVTFEATSFSYGHGGNSINKFVRWASTNHTAGTAASQNNGQGLTAEATVYVAPTYDITCSSTDQPTLCPL